MKSLQPHRLNILVCYDVNTITKEGAKRLRKVAKTCERYGQRVQYSVFECSLTSLLLETMRTRLLDIIDSEEDGLRIYYLRDSLESRCESYGIDHFVDFSGPLIL